MSRSRKEDEEQADEMAMPPTSLESRATGSLKSSAAKALAGQVLQAPLAQVALELERPAVPLHLVPQPQVLAQPFLLEADLLADPLLLLFQLAVVRL